MILTGNRERIPSNCIKLTSQSKDAKDMILTD